MEYTDVKKYELSMVKAEAIAPIHSWDEANDLMKNWNLQKGTETVELLNKAIIEYKNISDDILNNLSPTETEQKDLQSSLYTYAMDELMYEAAFSPLSVHYINEISDWSNISSAWTVYPRFFKLFGFKNWSDMRYPWYEILVNTPSPRIADVKTAISHCIHTYPFFNVCASFIRRGLNKHDGRCALYYLNITIKSFMLEDYKGAISGVIGITNSCGPEIVVDSTTPKIDYKIIEHRNNIVKKLELSLCMIKSGLKYEDFVSDVFTPGLNENDVIAIVKKYFDFSHVEKGTIKCLYDILRDNCRYSKTYQNFWGRVN